MDWTQDPNAIVTESIHPDQVFGALQTLSIEDLGQLLLHIPQKYPTLARILPSMPPDDVQAAWTGTCGEILLAQSCAYVHSVEAAYHRFTGRALSGKRILDYGCGWGRLLRLMYKFSPPANLYGCDAWDKAIELCRSHGVRANLALCDYVPRELPFPGIKFHLIYAFSVFTHLSSRTAKAVMQTLRNAVTEDGLLAITVRPIDYWDAHHQDANPVDIAAMKADHELRGFAFTPHNREPIDGDVTYGDASMATSYIRNAFDAWELVHEERSLADPYQRYCFLTPSLHRI